MTTAILDAKTHEFDVEDVEYLRHGDKPLLARVFKPRGDEPFPALVECHGGAWCLSDRTTERLRPLIPAERIVISESGILTRADVERVCKAGANAVLVGVSPWRSEIHSRSTSSLQQHGCSRVSMIPATAEPWLPKTTVIAAFPGGWMFGAPN